MLYVYRASAGSGKTHLLTGFYLRLLFREDLAAPEVGRAALFDEILAVTFTNKATAEMKTRIVEELETLAHDPRQSPYYTDLNQGGKVSDSALRSRAATILTRILNDYSNFHISTIDSFFQKIVRSFARELNVQGSYEVELNSDRVLEAAVGAFVDELDRGTDKALFEWMLDFSRDRISEGSSWDFKRDLLQMAKVLVSEEYRNYSDSIARFTADKGALRDYANSMKRVAHDFKTAVRQTGEDALMLMARHGLQPDDFSGGSRGFMRQFVKWSQGVLTAPTATFIGKVETPDKWFSASKGAARPSLPPEAVSAIADLMREEVRLFAEDYSQYLSAQAILANLYQLGILADLDRKVRDYCADQCVMLISSTTELLQRLIYKDESFGGVATGVDAPFIYEKVGAQIRHFMIDEFQDTSGLQWSNFMPLLSNSLAEGNHNLIVGDVKQSIYRWRGSDWGLLHSGLDHYETAQRHDDNTTLRTNWRSAAEVVGFNNEFFTFAARTMQGYYNDEAATPTDVLTRIYADVEQQVAPIRPQHGAGRVQIEFLAGKVKSDRVEEAMRRLPEVVIELQQHGYKADEIAILCRTNEICAESVSALLRYRAEHPECPYVLDVISDEALRLSSRPAIGTLVSLLQSLAHPTSALLRAVASAQLLHVAGYTTDEALRRYFGGASADDILQRLSARPLYEMVEALIGMLPEAVIRAEEPFLQAFRDLVLEFINGRTTDLTAFLTWWDESGVRKTISTPTAQQAVRVMTIHQSKGLGMPAVIIPYASWQMDIEPRGMLWCVPQHPTFARPNLVVPIRITRDLTHSIFAADYDEERMRCMIDNLNTAYVALTRAKEAMVILAPALDDEGKEPSASAQTRLECLLADFTQTGSGTYTRGEWVRPEAEPLAPLSVEDEPQSMAKGGNNEIEEDMAKSDEIKDATANSDEIKDATAKSNEIKDATAKSNDIKYAKAKSDDIEDTKSQSNEKASNAAELPHEIQAPVTRRLPYLSLKQSEVNLGDEARQRGNAIHAALSAVIGASDAAQRIEWLYDAGGVDASLISCDEMKTLVTKLIAQPSVAEWFADDVRILNEQTIVAKGDIQKRPDRLVMHPDGRVTVIDYKTGQRSRSHPEQVRGYMRLLRQMGFDRVEGFLWYITAGKIVAVS
jgi:ATP-dependent exoDNAse (exonuclease V) beta subunit